MALDLWFREDVARILAATQETMRNSMGAVSPVDPEVGTAYQRGFLDALRAVAIAFGVVPLVIPPGGMEPSSRSEAEWTNRPQQKTLYKRDCRIEEEDAR